MGLLIFTVRAVIGTAGRHGGAVAAGVTLRAHDDRVEDFDWRLQDMREVFALVEPAVMSKALPSRWRAARVRACEVLRVEVTG